MTRTGRLTRIALTLALAAGLFAAATASQSAVLTNTELRKLGATANTAAQHRRLAAHYNMRTAELEADAKAHQAIAKAALARTSDEERSALMLEATHLAEHSLQASEASRALAQLHERMATRSGR